MLLVENCFHWIGFHITNHLLEKGYHIIGIDAMDSEKKEHLSLFIGRHNAFHCYQTRPKNVQYDVIIRVHDHTLVLEKDRPIIVKLPYVFGEWMPVPNEGLHTCLDAIPLNADRYLLRAVYVADLVQSLEQWLAASWLPPVLNVRSVNDRQSQEVTLENSVYIRNNRSAVESADIVRDHYKRYGTFY